MCPHTRRKMRHCSRVAIVGLVCVYEYRNMVLPSASIMATVWLFAATILVYVSAVYSVTYLGICVGVAAVGSMVFATLSPGESVLTLIPVRFQYDARYLERFTTAALVAE